MTVLTPLLTRRLHYPRLKQEAGTALIIETSYLVQSECVRGFQANGWKVVSLPLTPPETFIERLLSSTLAHRPDVLFTINHLGFDREGILTGLLEEMRMPVLSWFVDSPAYILLNFKRNRSDWALVAVWEKTFIPFLKDFGFSHTLHLPLGGDPAVFKPLSGSPPTRYRCSFVGDSLVYGSAKWADKLPAFAGKAELIAQAGEELRLNRRCEPLQIAYSIAEQMGTALPPFNEEQSLSLASAVTLEGVRRHRRALAAAMAGREGHIFGDEGWRECLCGDVQLHPPVDYHRELSDIYYYTDINLNLTSLQMPAAVNQRVFDAPLAGGFLLTDGQEDLGELFDLETETAAFGEVCEIPDLTKFWKPRQNHRRQIVKRARKRILGHHTYRHRIARMIEEARRIFG